MAALMFVLRCWGPANYGIYGHGGSADRDGAGWLPLSAA
jgi:hypothetical protein